MKLLHIERHTTCLNYVSDYNICFIHQRLFSGGDFKIDNHHHSCILFLLKGEILTSCSEFHDQHIVEGHMVLFPQNDPNQSKSMTETEFILLFFDNQVNLHSKMSIELSAIHLESEKSCFYSLSICPPLRHVLDSICFYLKQKVQCSHMHELKQKEIFMVFGTFYNRTDMFPLPDAHHRARSEFQKFRIGKLPADTKHQTVCTIISLFRTFFQS